MSFKPWYFLILGIGLVLVLRTSPVHAQLSYVSGEAQIHVVELFSSEGCSSCPPAEEWMSKLKDHPELWKSFVPVEFHVDYWNQLGWVDPFSNAYFSSRQRAYSKEWYSNSVYTPGFVFDGEEWRGLQDFNLKVSQKKSKPGRLKVVQKKGSQFDVQFESKIADLQPFTLYFAVLGKGLLTRVPAGENEGKSLKHEFVVLSLKAVDLVKQGAHWKADFTLDKLPKDKAKSYAVAFWITKKGSLKPIQAVGGEIGRLEIEDRASAKK